MFYSLKQTSGKLLLFAFTLLALNCYSQTYIFSNTTVSAYNSWDSGNNWAAALSKTVAVSGVPVAGNILRQVNIFLGDGTNNTDLSSYAARLTDAAGNTVALFNTNYFYNGAFDQKYTNIHLRDHAKLKRVADYGTTSYLGVPYNWGYYRVETPGSFSAFNTTTNVNGTWTFEMIEGAGNEVKFNSVDLVFGPPFTVTDISSSNVNDNCSTPQCLQTGDIFIGTNGNSGVTYSTNISTDPPLTLSGCGWNGQKDNSAWFYFIASSATVNFSISGFETIQESIVFELGGTCAAPSYTLTACPDDNSATGMFMLLNGAGACNAAGNPTSSTKYYRTCYNAGTKWNHEYQLSGLTIGNTYFVLIDGQSAVISDFYIEMFSGADNGCSQSLPTANFTASTNAICPGTCIDFINMSTNATSYQWQFPGGNPSSDTSSNPTNICYSVSGTHDVTLTATNAAGTDTQTFIAYISVYSSPSAPVITQVGDTLFAPSGYATYQWYFGSDTLSGATNYFYVATQNGNYNLTVTDSNGCEVGAGILNVITSLTSNGSPKQRGVRVFSNSELQVFKIYFRHQLSVQSEITVYDIFGRKVFCKNTFSMNEITIDASGFANGIYVVQLNEGVNSYKATVGKN